MPARTCTQPGCEKPARILRPRNGAPTCKECFLSLFEDEVLATIKADGTPSRGDVVAVGASGGKDSTVLLHVLDTLNRKHSLGLDLQLVSVDEGIEGYRDHSLDTVHGNSRDYSLPLTIVPYKEMFGWTMDEIVGVIGSKGNCTYCGVFRRQALEWGAAKVGATVIVTGHNADDAAETVLMNLLRGDVARLARLADHVTGGDAAAAAAAGTANGTVNGTATSVPGASRAPRHQSGNGDNHSARDLAGSASEVSIEDAAAGLAAKEQSAAPAPAPARPQLPRAKPLRMCYEKEIVMYARFLGLHYFSTECTHAGEAFRGGARVLIKELERVRPEAILDVVRSGEAMARGVAASSAAAAANPKKGGARNAPTVQGLRSCERCGLMASQRLCKACVLLEQLDKGRAKVGIEVDSGEDVPSSQRAGARGCGGGCSGIPSGGACT